MILDSERQRQDLLSLVSSATVQGVENAKRLIELYEAIKNASIADSQN